MTMKKKLDTTDSKEQKWETFLKDVQTIPEFTFDKEFGYRIHYNADSFSDVMVYSSDLDESTKQWYLNLKYVYHTYLRRTLSSEHDRRFGTENSKHLELFYDNCFFLDKVGDYLNDIYETINQYEDTKEYKIQCYRSIHEYYYVSPSPSPQGRSPIPNSSPEYFPETCTPTQQKEFEEVYVTPYKKMMESLKFLRNNLELPFLYPVRNVLVKPENKKVYI